MKVTCILLILTLILSGCSSQTIKVVTYPAGAEISIGKRTCTSPCDIVILSNSEIIDAKLPDGRQEQIKISDSLEKDQNIAGDIVYDTGRLLKIGAGIFVSIGVLAASLLLIDYNDENHEIDIDKKYQRNLGIAIALSWLGFGALNSMGDELKKADKSENRIDIEFQPETEDKLKRQL